MNKRTLAMLIGAAALSAGCQTVILQPVARPSDVDCKGKGECAVTVDPQKGAPAYITVSKNSPAVIRWSVEPLGGRYTFYWTGISFESAADGVIECPFVVVGHTRTCHYKGRPDMPDGKFKYTITYWDREKLEKLVDDPWVLNR